jgi:hypothetical protein
MERIGRSMYYIYYYLIYLSPHDSPFSTVYAYLTLEKNKCPQGILPSGRPLHTKVGDGGWMGKLVPGLGRVSG